MSDNFIKNLIDKNEYLEKQREYWLRKMEGEVTQGGLPFDNHLASLVQTEKESVKYYFPEELSSKIIKLSNNSEQRLFTILSCGLSAVFYKYSGNEDVVFGTPVFKKDIDDEVINHVLVIRNRVTGEMAFRDLLYEVRQNVEEAITYQNYPVSRVMEYAGIEVPEDCLAYFETVVMLDSIHNRKCLNKVHCNTIFCFSVKDNGLVLTIEYDPALYTRLIVDGAPCHLINLLDSALHNISLTVSEIEMLGVDEKNRILYEFNDTGTEYPKDKTIIELFEEQAKLAPENEAIVHGDISITFKQLDDRANLIASLLREEGLCAGGVAGIISEVSEGFIVGILGILKTQGAYLPIDISYPAERIQYMLQDSGAKVLLISGHPDIGDIDFQGRVIDLDDDSLYSGEGAAPERDNSHESLAYVIYTSGTTGRPKGVMVTNKGLVNYIWWAKKVYTKGEKVDFPLYSSVSFDLTVTSVFTPLISGNKILIYNGQDKLKLLRCIIEDNKAGIIKLTPTHLKLLEEMDIDKTRVKKLIVGGENLKTEQARIIYQNFRGNVEIYNEYGPTETVVGCMIYKYDPETDKRVSVPIGKPADNVQLYILDRDLNPVPDFVMGEIYISGDGVARGYINNNELTEERFVLNPFIPGKRMYKTGDLARRLENGNLEYIRRSDSQVKIRGYRIELTEIESRLSGFNGIKQAVAIMKEDSSHDMYICCYFVADKVVYEPEIRSYLSRELPQYMIPAYFIQIESIPVSLNGKVDVKELPAPVKTKHEDFVPPRNEIEEKLVKMWKDILSVDNIGVYNDFFDFGGHSLRATVLINRISKELNVEIPLGEIFRAPTIAAISQYIENTDEKMHSAIEPSENKEYYQVSSAQRRMFILNKFEDMGITYNTPVIFMVSGSLDINNFNNVIEALIKRHETLRTHFEIRDSQLVQIINPETEFKAEMIEAEETEISELIKRFIRPFDLSKAPLLRVTLAKLMEEKHLLMIDMHHIITDGVSLNILIKEFADLYEGRKLPALRIQYKDFSEWQNKLFKTGAIEEQESYWMNVFKGELPVLNLPTDYPRPNVQSLEGHSVQFEAGEELSVALNRIAAQTNSTMYMVLLAAYNVLLSKYCGQEDIIIGSPIAGRHHADLENVIGMFINMLAMRNYPAADITFGEFLHAVKENSLSAFEAQDYQFEELIEKLNLKRDFGRHPLFDCAFIFQNFETTDIAISDLTISYYGFKKSMSKFDLTLNAGGQLNRVWFEIDYSSALFKRETIERFISHYLNILQQITENPEKKLREIELVTKEEKFRILEDFNSTKKEYSKNILIHELFEEQVRKTPDNIAVVYEDKKLTFNELNIKANKLARVLRQKNTAGDSIVGIMVERSIEMIVGIMGILKAGGAYLPISPDYPLERIKYMLVNSKSDILLTQSGLREELEFSGDKLYLDMDELYYENGENLPAANSQDSLAYVIYTSGSTGKPKGVMVEHHSVINLVEGLKEKIYSLYEGSLNVALVAPYVFDASVQQIFACLLLGHSLFIVPEDVRTDGDSLVRYLADRAIDISDGTPGHIALMVNAIVPLEGNIRVRHFIIGGEALHPRTVEKFFDRFDGERPRISNIYGPTECTVDSTCYLIDENRIRKMDSIPIGKPLINSRVYILGKNMEVAPVGIEGDVYIAGKGVSRGYLDRPELTEESFIPDPFVPGERMYKTGDKGKWMFDGNISFMGRTDHQVKVRGYRIETGEIENVLMKHEAIKETVVEVKTEAAGKYETPENYLCAYIISDTTLESSGLREHLSKELPEYMVPAYFVQLENIPKTKSGKIDRQALPDPQDFDRCEREYEAPRDEAEENMQEIWQTVLGVEPIGINDNFFELGGHSLKAAILLANIHKKFNVIIPIKEIFAFPTIKTLVGLIRDTNKSVYTAIEPALKKEYYPASSAQKRLYILQQYEGAGTTYNTPVVMIVEGPLDRGRFEDTLDRLIQRHESFRTAFEIIGEETVQKVFEKVDFNIKYIEIDESIIDETVQGFIQPFELSKAPLFRVVLAKITQTKYVLMIDMHHIITDGVSMNILIREFADLYRGLELPELKIQYKDFSEWQNRLYISGDMGRQEEYWLDTFKGELPVSSIPTDYPRPPMQSFEGNALTFSINKTLVESLNRLALRTGATLYMLLMAAYNILLSKYTGQEDIIVGSPVAGRQHADLENVIGMFVNTLALRNYPKGNKTFEQFLQEVKTNTLKAFENQDYKFEELVEKLELKRDTGRNPLFDTMLILQNTQNAEIKIPGLEFISYGFEKRIAKFDAVLTAMETNNGIFFEIEYCTKLFKEETIEMLGRHFINILSQIAQFPRKTISELELLDDEEKKKLLDFNNTEFVYPKEKLLQEFFEEQAKEVPGNIAIEYEGNRITYRELNIKSNRLARILRQNGVNAGNILGIMAEPSIQMMVGILGILKAGGAYLPINPDYPAERIEYMLEDSKVDIILMGSGIKNELKFAGKIVDLDNLDLKTGSGVNLKKTSSSTDAAAIIYTSGSTGAPKGVILQHTGIINHIYTKIHELEIKSHYNLCLNLNITFVASIWQMFCPLSIGAKLIIYPRNISGDADMLFKNVENDKVVIAEVVPSLLSAYLENLYTNKKLELPLLEKLIVTGEKVTTSLVNRFYSEYNIPLVNAYGQSECSDDTLHYHIPYSTDSRAVPIGKPALNTQIYILDSQLRLQPVGIPGEIYISGDGLALGYLNLPDQTRERFIQNPFIAGSRMFKTGDLGRWLPDGNVEYLGRSDYQLKIRGYRIEPGEIEAKLLEYPGVKAAVVTAGGERHDTLNAYIVSDQELDTRKIREFLSNRLPEYMVPQYYMQLGILPLNSNGKVDRQALPAVENAAYMGIEYVAPQTSTQERLSYIWQDILKLDRVGINDNFFAVGGHSLRATKLVSRIFKEFNVKIALREIFIMPTVSQLAEFIETAKQESYHAINPVEKREYYPLSSAQKRMFTIYQMRGHGTEYNLPLIMAVDGLLDKDRFEDTLRGLIRRHEVFRTSFEIVDNEPVQRIHEEVEFTVSYLECTSDEEARAIIRDFVSPFDLAKAPLLRAGLVRISQTRHILICDVHHIITDGTSMGIIMYEFVKLYEGKQLQELKIQYKDFAVWQNNFFNTNLMLKQKEYWLKIFSDEVPVLNIPTDYPRPAIRSFEGDSLSFVSDRELTRSLNQLSLETGTTLFMVFLSVYNIVLHKYTGQEDIIVGTGIAGRTHEDLNSTVGMFVNLLALRNSPKADMSFREFLQEVGTNALEAFENQDYQYEELVEHVNIKKDLSRNPLFDTVLAWQNMDVPSIGIDSLNFTPFGMGHDAASFDFTLRATESEDLVAFSLNYCTRLFARETMEAMSEHILRAAREIAENPDVKLGKINILSAAEERKLLEVFNRTRIDLDLDMNIVELFEQQVEKTPDNIALIYDDTALTYRDLNHKANSFAELLRSKGAGPENVVAVMVERSHDMAIAILGILKSGAAYLPVDFSYPEGRISYMLEDSGAGVLITQNHLLNKVIDYNGEIIDISTFQYVNGDGSNPRKVNSSHNLAYIIYTSGTEGRPKGVMVEHRSISNTIQWRRNEYALGEKDVVLQLFSHTFDGFLTSFFTPIVSGSCVVILKEEHSKDPVAIAGYIQKYRVTHFIAVPNLYDTILEYASASDLKSLRIVTLAGDKVSSALVTKSKTKYKNIEIVNEYGPTENSVATTVCRNLGTDRNIFIGKPIANTKVYILGENNRLQPVGVAGELCISGEGLARGYLNRGELDREKFVQNPFEPGKRMYRTGDLARWHADGNIEFAGRLDQQVKIRGYRIEVMEIENAIQQYHPIQQAVVVDRDDKDGNKSLYAYYVSDEDINIQNLKECLSRSLPQYMLPSGFTRLDTLPLTHNGKIDRKALGKLEVKEPVNSSTDFTAPRNNIEEKLVKLWAKVLSINEEKISTTHDFFEIGGHSLRATALLNEIHKEFNVEVPLGQLFEKPTIKDLGEYISGSGKTEYFAIEKAEMKEYYAVSAAQKRLYILDKLEGANTAYNIPVVIKVDGMLDIERFEETINKLLHRHEALRTSFSFINEEVVQTIHDSINIKIEFLDKDESEVKDVIKTFIRPFDLSVAPLIRVALISLSQDKHLLMWDIHHIVTDGVSMGILIKEFSDIYGGRELPPLRIQFKDFSEWQNSIIQKEQMDSQRQYWLRIFEDEIPLLDMPTDYPRPSVQSFEGDTFGFRIERELVEKLNAIAAETGTTNYMVILSIYNILLSKYTGQEDIVVGTPVAGRHHADLKNIVGVFVNTLAMRNSPQQRYSFSEFLMNVRKNSLEAFQNQDYQFEDLVNALDLTRDMGRNPLFDTMFSLQNTQDMEISIDGLLFSAYGFENRIAKFDLSLYAIENGDDMDFAIEFCTRLYKRDTIKRMSDHFVHIIEQITSNPNIMLSEIELITGTEKAKIINEFNNTRSEYQRQKTLNHLFREQVNLSSKRGAVLFEGTELTYKALDEKSDRLAGMLRGKGVKRNTIVGIMAERSLEMMIGILGILKAGGAYMPIDPNYPYDRIKFMLENSQAGLLLTQEQFAHRTEYPVEMINIQNESLYSKYDAGIDIINQPEDLAYVIYTSGTTGKPKGVMIEHHSVINRLNWMQKQYCLNKDDVILQKTPYTFDVSIWELFWWFLAGAKICFLKPGGEKDPDCIIDSIYTNKITTIHFVPSMLSMFLEYLEYTPHEDKLSGLKRVFASGEALSLQHVRTFNILLSKKTGVQLHNLYGPTEATVDVSYFDCSQADNYSTVPIGKPIDNIKLLILDKNKNMLPIGVVGDLYITGAGIARGYLNNLDLTEEKFIPNPYAFEGDNTPGLDRMYKTGDLAKWLEDGNIEYLGRTDSQVKIRGFRIELGEIEKCMTDHESVKECIVESIEDGFEGRQLIAYYTASKELLVSDLYLHLSKTLPEYMIPNAYMYMNAFPVTSNGKVDRKALRALYDNRLLLRNKYTTPSTDTEKALQGFWEHLLKIDLIGIEDNFFELGGNSLLAIKLHNLIEKKYPGTIKIADIFSYPTISKMAQYMNNGMNKTASLKELDKIILPDQYFTDSEQEDDIIKVIFEESVYDSLKQLALRENVELPDILLSAFAGVLSDVSGLERFTLHGAVDTDSFINILDINLRDIEEYGLLFKQVNNKRLQTSDNSYPLSLLETIVTEKNDNQIIPLFVYSSNLEGNLLGIYDIILSSYEDDGLCITCEFNASRLKRDKVENMLYSFAQLIGMLNGEQT